MNKPTIPQKLIGLLFTLTVATSPLFAQHKREATPRRPATPPAPAREAEPAPDFDTLIAADAYKVYVEVRAVGQLAHSPALHEVIDPALKLLGGGNEPKTILKWLTAHADALMGSRALVAAWPSKKNLPEAVVAIEFSSPEEAQKFEPELRSLIANLRGAPQGGGPDNSIRPSLHIITAGSLLLLSEKPFSFRTLRPTRAKLLAEDPNFVVAHNRFASESLFLYVNVKAIEKEDQAQRQKWQEEERKRLEEEASRPKPEPPPPPVEEPTVIEQTQIAPAETLTATPDSGATLSAAPVVSPRNQDGQDFNGIFSISTAIYGALFSGPANWPEAVAAAINLEDEAYVVRALVLNGAETKVLPVPFFPHFISGPAVTPQSPSVLPGDADLFVSASLDYPQIYDGLLRTIYFNNARSLAGSPQVVNLPLPSSPFASYEKKLGLKIKDDILPLLGNELGFAFVPKPVETANPAVPETPGPPKAAPDPEPVAAIAVRDKDGVRRLIPKLLESFGLKGAAALAQTERKDDTEIVSYANWLSYAFIGDFLVIAPNASVTKRVVNAYLNGETLAANGRFRNAKRWQAREMLGQVYVAPAVIQRYGFGFRANNNMFVDATSRLATVEPLTYSLSNEGSGPLHELHVPKSLLSFLMSGATNDVSNSVIVNEAMAQNKLRTFVSAEEVYKTSSGAGRYGTLAELVTAGLVSTEMMKSNGYRIEAIVSDNGFQISAVPIEYGKTGKTSFFVDQTAVLRGGDHGGGDATISDPPIE